MKNEKNRKVVSILASVAVVATLFVGCGNKPAGDVSKAPAGEGKKIKVGLVTDVGGINDKSFNQSADTGIKKAVSEGGVDYKYLESDKEEKYVPNLTSLIDEFETDVLFAIGFKMEGATEEVAKKYPDKKLVLIDSPAFEDPNAENKVQAKNVESIIFKENEGSFLMGVIAGKTTVTNKVGFIGGMNVPLIERFEAGFAAGVKAVNPEAAKGLVAKDEKTTATMVKYVGDFDKPDLGNEAAKVLYGQGCDVIFHAAGGSGKGLFDAALELKKGGKNVWAIGVDMDQAVTLPAYADIMLSSMIKKVDVATYAAIKDIEKGTFKGGQMLELGIKEDAVGIAETTKNHCKKEVIDLANKYSGEIKAGNIKVPVTRGEVIDFKAPELK